MMPRNELKLRLQMLRARDAMEAAGVEPAVIDRIEAAAHASDMFNAFLSMLLANPDESKAKNYVALTIEGLRLPFDRAIIELVKPGGRHSSEVVTEMRGSLESAIQLLRTNPGVDVIESYIAALVKRYGLDDAHFAGEDPAPKEMP